MINGPSEPEKYSIDEMMDRLKTRPSGDPSTEGEMVTREDGSQAIRVRKRKRRSHQPLKEKAVKERRTRAVQIVALVLVMVTLLMTVGALFVYANSAPYRNGIIARITASTGAEVDLQQFRVNPAGANATQVTFNWPNGNVLKSLSLRNVTADVASTSWVGKSWRGEEITAREGELALGLPEEGASLLAQPLPTDGTPVVFNRMAVDKLNIVMGRREQPAIRIYGAEGSLYPKNSNGRTEVRLSRGEFKVAGWPALALDRARFEFRNRLIDVIGIRFFATGDDTGFFELSGTLDPYNPKQDSTLQARLEGLPLATLAGETIGRLFSGRIDSREVANSNYLTFNPDGSRETSLVVAFRAALSSQIQVSGLPVFFALARGLGDDWFAQPVFTEESTGTIRRDLATIELSDLSLTQKGRLALRGDLKLDADQNLSGTLRIGLAEAIIATASSRTLNRTFSETSEGFRWVELTISGHSSRPTDNFSVLYEAAVAAEAAGPDDEGPNTFDELTRPR